MADFGENVAPTAAIRAILGSYPFSIGLLREILQNSDDAKASEQIFVLDRRAHGTNAIHHPDFAAIQGPALLAFNNELIQDEDWKALRNIHRSSKTMDTSKIGKYGIGFRSSYHVTDTPNILSGSHLAILDPQLNLTESGGIKLDIATESSKYSDHLAAFGSLFPSSEWGKPFNGSIFRLPLRQAPSEISHEIIAPDTISDLLRDFAREELNISLLFLRNVTSIKIYEISVDGEKTQLATATINRTPLEDQGEYQLHKAVIRTDLSGSLEEREWRILHAPFSETEAVDALSRRLGGNPTATLSQHKLNPTMDLAIPLNCSNMTKIGRLFTFLPLPLRTEFPVHINALFSLTQSRQNLRNGGEVGIVKNSDDHALIEWNRLLFDTYIPRAWANLLNVLVNHDQVQGVFDVWPSSQAEVQSGDYVYWKDILSRVAEYALEFPIWPVCGMDPLLYEVITSLLIAGSSTEDDFLNALVRTGLRITQPPHYLTQVILSNHTSSIKMLSPEIVHGELQPFISNITNLPNTDADTILAYLLSTSNCRYIENLPLVPSVAHNRVALVAPTSSTSYHVLFGEIEEKLFGTYDPTAVSLKQLTPDVRGTLLNNGCQTLNLTKLDSSKAVNYLGASLYVSQPQRGATGAEVDWLNLFWDWAQTSISNLRVLDQFYLVPTTSGFQRPSDAVFHPESDSEIAKLLEPLNVPVIDTRFSTRARGALRQLQPSSNIHALLRALSPTINVEFSEDQAKCLGSYLIRHLPTACYRYGSISTDHTLRTRLRGLPIFPILSLSPDGSSTDRGSIVSSISVRGVDPSGIPVLPRIGSIVYLNLRCMSQDILQYLDPRYHSPLSLDEMHDMMLEHICAQSLDIQVAFVKYLVSHSRAIPRAVLDRLATIEFVPACDGTLRSPKHLIDPDAAIATLYPGASSSLPNTSRPILTDLVTNLRNLKLLITELSLDVVRERICYVAGGRCTEPENLARRLINTINDSRIDCGRLFDLSQPSLDMEWVPTPEGLKSPLQCRDAQSHSGKSNLFDEVMPMVRSDVRIGFYLRRAFPWDGEVTFEIIYEQLVKVLDGPKPPYEKVREIVKELGHRRLTGSQLTTLRKGLHDRKWVPTRSGTLERIAFSLLGAEDIPEIGFHSVVFDSYRHANVRMFLQEMGCVERPSENAILELLKSLCESGASETPNTRVTRGLIHLLSWLPVLGPDERTRLFVPDTSGILRPFNDICYNDVGPRASLVDIGSNFLAHPTISDELATVLGLRRLGLLGLESQYDDEPDMGEDLMTTIRNRLREYTDSQLLLEFLANASDAGAKEFNVLLDEKIAQTKALISPRCSGFQSVPALVIHNDSVFQDDDFKGILRTGVGGKVERRDTIGQFGFGALTMFHITEFAMIVSGDQVLFLNPCKAHLSIGRASLRIPLSTVRKLYSDHLSPLKGLFGFNIPEDIDEDYSYNGTLFRLPLRSSTQFHDIEPVFKKMVSLGDIASSFKSVASNCLLFTSISSIRCFDRRHRDPFLLWSVSATRSDYSEVKERVKAHTVTITGSESVTRDQEWRILSIAVNDRQFPPFIPSLQEKYRLRLPPIVRVAAPSSPVHCSHLFSTLPLPITLDLPVHISGSFILASDRRSIRLDEYENVEASYNRWLLKVIVPMLYSYLLEDRAAYGDNAPYWPGNRKVLAKDTHNVISALVMDSVYQTVATSSASIFRSKYHPHALAPQDACVIDKTLSPTTTKVLDVIQPPDIVKLPTSVTKRLQKVDEARFSLVTPKYVHTQILTNPSRFNASMLDFDQLQDLIDFLSRGPDALECLVGLILLPLADGTFAKFNVLPGPCFYVIPPRAIEKAVFKPHRIVHGRLNTTKLLEMNKLNVKSISNSNIGALLDDHISTSPTLENADDATQIWIKKFWKVFSSLKVSTDTITDYPLIPTLQPRYYLSLTYCTKSSAILADFTDHPLQATCLTQMGFTLIDRASLQKDVRSIVKPLELSVENVLVKLFNRSQSISTLFNFLESEVRARFTSWIRSEIGYRKKGYFNKHWQYSALPLWRTADGSPISANDLVMLPLHVTVESVAAFAPRTIVAYDHLLAAMGVQPPSSLQSILNIPTLLDEHSEEAYGRLISALLNHTPAKSSIPVPNSQRLIRDSSALYSSRDPLFRAAFGSNSERFIHSSFRPFENELEKHGLQRQHGLSIATFRDCLVVFQDATGRDLVNRATEIFQIFSEYLPLYVNSSEDGEWETLDQLRFIPREQSPQPLPGVNCSRYIASRVRFLPSVVSPNKLVQKQFIAIAWSQRAFYKTEPHSRILMTYPGLSVPSAEEVVNHLVVLATEVATDHSRHSTLLDHLEKTYKWLNENTEAAEPFLTQCTENGIPLLLNVDDPKNTAEEWKWKKADHILLDTYDTGFLECPRDFIKPFHDLLVAAGAVAIDYGQEVEPSQTESTNEEQQANLSNSFNQMRNDGICTDVQFFFDSPNEKPLRAHRAYLAAHSGHFKDMFSGDFVEAGNASSANPIRVDVPGFSKRSVEYIINFVYTGKEPELKREEWEVALEMILLGHAWSMREAQDVVQGVMFSLKMVDPFNLDHVRPTAEKTESTELVKHCIEYEKRNKKLVQHAREQAEE